jgi:hypothetical protein
MISKAKWRWVVLVGVLVTGGPLPWSRLRDNERHKYPRPILEKQPEISSSTEGSAA